MKVQQTLAQTWKRRRDSDHAEAKRLIEERGVGLLRVPDELLDIILGYSDLRTRFAAVGLGTVVETNSATYEFSVPRRVFTNVDDRFEAGLPYSVRVKIVATRRRRRRGGLRPGTGPDVVLRHFVELEHLSFYFQCPREDGESMDGLRLRSIRLRCLGLRERGRLRRRDGGRPVGRLEWRIRLVRRGGGVERVPLPQPSRSAPGEGRVIS